MKNLFFTIISCVLIASCSQVPEGYVEMQYASRGERLGSELIYKESSLRESEPIIYLVRKTMKPYTGIKKWETKEGEKSLYTFNGGLLVKQIHLDNKGLLVSESASFPEQGYYRQEHYRDGVLKMYWESNNGNESIVGESYYDNGSLSWKQTEKLVQTWYKNGQKQYEVPVQLGKWDGKMKMWNEDGSYLGEVEYKNNRIVQS